ncbi:cytochrome P450 93A3-like [Telopea speciosissima]|uniref:cytochrome P450 93A3-like n=1 Tax=Telopea speciosissima TaxID=54955 RepID=UPI001CC3D620|nr:cytochrome P450 93A3-like [Telopea speciosissima]
MVDLTIEPQHLCFLFFIFLISTLLCLCLSFHRKPRNQFKLPPSPPSLPIIGHLHLIGSILHQSLQSLSNKHGPLISLHLGASHCLVASSSSIAKEIFKTHDLIFALRPKFAFEEQTSLYHGCSFLMAPYGPYWRFMKKLCMTKLLGEQQLKRFVCVKQEEIRRFLKRLLKSYQDGKPVDMGVELRVLTNNIICRMAMSTRSAESINEAEECRELVHEISAVGAKMCLGEVLGPFGKLDWFGYQRKMKEAIKRFDDLMERILQEHQRRPHKNKNNNDQDGERENKDLMDILLEISQDEKAEVKLTQTGIKSFFLETFSGGTDTSAKAMQWALALLINHPGEFKKVRDEIELMVGKTRLVEESDIHKLPYLQAIIKETLRLYPTFPVVSRECTQDCKIGGYDVLKKTRVLVNLYTIMRDPNSWEEPNEFRPQRFFVNSKESIQNQMKNNKFIPFGGGRRSCPGSSHALTVMYITIASMVQCFDWKIHGENGATSIPANMEHGSELTLGMAHPLVCLPIPQLCPFIAFS